MIDVDPNESRTASSSPRSAIPTGRTPSAASSARPTAARRSRRCSTRTSTRAATTCASIRANPNIVYAALWQQQQSFIEGGGFGGAGDGIFKSTDGGTTWKQLTDGLPQRDRRRTSRSRRATRRCSTRRSRAAAPADAAAQRRRPASSASTSRPTAASTGRSRARPERRRSVPRRSASARAHRRRRSADAHRRSEERERRLQRVDRVLAHRGRRRDLDRGARRARRRRLSEDRGSTRTTRTSSSSSPTRAAWSRPIAARRGATGTRSRRRRCITSSTDNAFPYRVCGGQQDSGSACVDSRSMDGEITFHDWHPVNIQEYGIAAPDPKDPDLVFGSARTNVSLYNRKTGQTTHVGPERRRRAARSSTATCARCRSTGRRSIRTCCSTRRTRCGRRPIAAHSWTRISPDLARQTWEVPANAGKYASTRDAGAAGQRSPRSSPSPRDINVLWAGTDDGNIQVTTDGGAKWTNVTPPRDQAVDAHLQHRRRPLRRRAPRTPRRTRCASTT